MGQDLGRDQDPPDGRISQERGVPFPSPMAPFCPFFAVPSKIYLAMLQRVMPFAEKYFARPLGSEGILSLSLHHSAREGRPQGH